MTSIISHVKSASSYLFKFDVFVLAEQRLIVILKRHIHLDLIYVYVEKYSLTLPLMVSSCEWFSKTVGV